MIFQKFNRLFTLSVLIALLFFLLYYFYTKGIIKDFEKNIEQKNIEQKNKINIDLKWKELKNNLWINKNKEIGIKFFYKKDYFDYVTQIGFLEPISLVKIIDTCSFVRLSKNHYKDSKNIYFVNHDSFLTKIEIYNKVNINSFESLNDIYSKDNENIYYGSEILEDVDYNTFSVKKYSLFGLAKDKYGLIANGKRDKNEIEMILKIEMKLFKAETEEFTKNSHMLFTNNLKNIIKFENKIKKNHPNTTIEIKHLNDKYIFYSIKDKSGNEKIEILKYDNPYRSDISPQDSSFRSDSSE